MPFSRSTALLPYPALKKQAQAEIELLRNQEALAITQVQGTEEQKAIAIEGIKDKYRDWEIYGSSTRECSI